MTKDPDVGQMLLLTDQSRAWNISGSLHRIEAIFSIYSLQDVGQMKFGRIYSKRFHRNILDKNTYVIITLEIKAV